MLYNGDTTRLLESGGSASSALDTDADRIR